MGNCCEKKMQKRQLHQECGLVDRSDGESCRRRGVCGTCRAECSQGRKMDDGGRGGGLTCPHLLFVCFPWRPWGCSVQQRGVLGDKFHGRVQTKRGEERTRTLQVNGKEQLAGSQLQLEFQTINDPSLLRDNKEQRNTAATPPSASYSALQLLSALFKSSNLDRA